VSAAAVACALFCAVYFTSYREQLAPYFESRDHMPYMDTLFYEKVPPHDFADSVVYLNPDGAFRWPEYFSWRDSGGEYHEWRQE
jgi:hypothetical protein